VVAAVVAMVVVAVVAVVAVVVASCYMGLATGVVGSRGRPAGR
jgi:hypothetical protein